jgi:hypothetical protein
MAIAVPLARITKVAPHDVHAYSSVDVPIAAPL